MNWNDCEFIRDTPLAPEAESAIELTGWETIVFELADEEEVDS